MNSSTENKYICAMFAVCVRVLPSLMKPPPPQPYPNPTVPQPLDDKSDLGHQAPVILMVTPLLHVLLLSPLVFGQPLYCPLTMKTKKRT